MVMQRMQHSQANSRYTLINLHIRQTFSQNEKSLDKSYVTYLDQSKTIHFPPLFLRGTKKHIIYKTRRQNIAV